MTNIKKVNTIVIRKNILYITLFLFVILFITIAFYLVHRTNLINKELIAKINFLSINNDKNLKYQRFILYQHPTNIKYQYILDAKYGRVWILSQDPNQEYYRWTEMDIENIFISFCDEKKLQRENVKMTFDEIDRDIESRYETLSKWLRNNR